MMLTISLENINKKFVREWIIRDCNYTFQSGKSYAVTGPNGSGKSSLAQILIGYSTPTSGKITFTNGDSSLAVDEVYRIMSFAAPYMELIEEFTLAEQLDFHFKLKKSVAGITVREIPALMQLEKSRNKQIRNFSSGMKQRLKLGLAFFTEADLIVLDEPTTNLDESGMNWYLENVQKLKKEKLLVICSNQEREYTFCDETVSLMNWK